MSSSLFVLGAKIVGQIAIKAFLKRLDSTLTKQEHTEDDTKHDIHRYGDIKNARVLLQRIQQELPKCATFMLQHPEIQEEVREGLLRLCQEMEILPTIVEQEGFDGRLLAWTQTLQLVLQELEHPEGDMSVNRIRILLQNYFVLYSNTDEKGEIMSEEIKETLGIYPKVTIDEVQFDKEIADHFKQEGKLCLEGKNDYQGKPGIVVHPESLEYAETLLQEFIHELEKVAEHNNDCIIIPKQILGVMIRSTVYRTLVQKRYQTKE